jgi:hypothetical protein
MFKNMQIVENRKIDSMAFRPESQGSIERSHQVLAE